MNDIKNIVGAIVLTGFIIGFLVFMSIAGALLAPIAMGIFAVAVVYALFFHEDKD